MNPVTLLREIVVDVYDHVRWIFTFYYRNPGCLLQVALFWTFMVMVCLLIIIEFGGTEFAGVRIREWPE